MAGWMRASAVIAVIAWHSPTHGERPPAAADLARTGADLARDGALRALDTQVARDAAARVAGAVIDRAAPGLDPALKARLAEEGLRATRQTLQRP
jgi:hypothetical protein